MVILSAATSLHRIPEDFRRNADTLEPYAPPAAEAYREAARIVEEALRDHLDARLSLDEAEQESGYTARHLAKLVRDGVIPGLPGGSIQRRHLPRKPGHGIVNTPPVRPTRRSARSEVARAAAAEE